MTSRLLTRVLPAVAGVWVLTGAPTAQQAAPSERGTIRGVVVDDRDQPVAGAHVGAAVGDRTTGTLITTRTDASGRFVLEGLVPATYTLALSKDGYANTAFGVRVPHGPATAIPLAAGQVRDIRARLPRSAVISGVVRGQDGEPLPGADVAASRWVWTGGRRALMGAGPSVSANSRGEYRLFGLSAGRYLVCANSYYILRDAVIEDLRSPGRALTFQPRCFPGVSDTSLAVDVVAWPGVEVNGIDLSLEPEPAGTIVVEVNTAPEAFSTVRVSRRPADGAARPTGSGPLRMATRMPDGRFLLRSVPAGRHVVEVRATGRGSGSSARLWAIAPIIVGAGTHRLSLTPAPGATVLGRYASDADGPLPDSSRFRPRLVRVSGRFSRTTLSGVQTRAVPGGFEISGVPEGEYLIELANLPAPWAPLAAEADGLDILDQPVQVQPGQHLDTLVVTLTNHTSSVSGTVTSAGGRPDYAASVLVFPVDTQRRTPGSRWVALGQPDIDGRYEIAGLLPGGYFVAAAPIDWNPALEPERLASLEAGAQRVQLHAGQSVTLDVRTGGGR